MSHWENRLTKLYLSCIFQLGTVFEDTQADSQLSAFVSSSRLIFVSLSNSGGFGIFSISCRWRRQRDEEITVDVSTLTWRCRWVDNVQTDGEKWRCQSWEAELWRDSWGITLSSPKNEVEEAGEEAETPSDGHLHKKCGLDAVMCVKRTLFSWCRRKHDAEWREERRKFLWRYRYSFLPLSLTHVIVYFESSWGKKCLVVSSSSSS